MLCNLEINDTTMIELLRQAAKENMTVEKYIEFMLDGRKGLE